MSDFLDLQAFGLVATAGGLGALIGLERELNDKPAGLRTHIFVAAGSALLIVLAEGAVDYFQLRSPANQIAADPVRVIQAIVVGISFLGAGTIVQREGNRIEGLTTAASIYLTAGIGVAVAVGRTWLAIETTLFAVLVLISARWIEGRLLGKKRPAERDSTRSDSHSKPPPPAFPSQ